MFTRTKELAEKRTHLRAGVEKFMNNFAEETQGLEGFSAIVFQESKNGYDYDCSIRTGKNDLYIDQSDYCEDKWADFDDSRLFSDCMSIADLREICRNLEKGIMKIQSEINGECEAIDKILAKMK